ncbi:MAG: DUF4058 family protein [Tepidisphaerales bacterium]
MKSPFPGMDPYMEPHWLDVHARLVTYVADTLNEELPPGLVASTEERVAIESEEDRVHLARPDISVVAPAKAGDATAALLDAPYRLVLDYDPITEHYIRILDTHGNRLVTVVEVLSPTNKSGEGLIEYRRKRSHLIQAQVHVVEIDLVRRGDWRALLRPYTWPVEATTTYRVAIHAAAERREVYLYPIRLIDALPTISIPLRASDRPVQLSLQQMIEQVYTRGRYAQRLDYREPCDPPLTEQEAAWAAELLKEAARS